MFHVNTSNKLPRHSWDPCWHSKSQLNIVEIWKILVKRRFELPSIRFLLLVSIAVGIDHHLKGFVWHLLSVKHRHSIWQAIAQFIICPPFLESLSFLPKNLPSWYRCPSVFQKQWRACQWQKPCRWIRKVTKKIMMDDAEVHQWARKEKEENMRKAKINFRIQLDTKNLQPGQKDS